MQRVTLWILAAGAVLVLAALAIVGLNKKPEKPAAGSPEQMAAAREARELKRLSKQQDEENTQSENQQ